ncbi:RHS repeat-associated core domain-containing protein [Pseudomonas sp. MUP55]|uniref:RHS repeat-associated core domain-containing protein n=1 Tax=Pseudomonas sp. MUP55 TaxID=3087234 RepID=UPI002A5AACB5|nr:MULTISPECIES: RHS repeat-associated core domain-containing protein [unclassified Pseudomonas]WPN91082.1 RHS repeat-associated core domain-containing protein [Pseudomonas sp. MUP56]WPN96608.1 RHS repeat-associated core domain-containing protein [Pseudomonas sp. MUP55]
MSASLHRNTPSLAAFDPRGLTVRSVAYLRATSEAAPTTRVRRHVYGASGLLLEQWDPRLLTRKSREPSTEANQVSVYSLSGTLIRSKAVDAGTRLMLAGAAGQLLHAWDGRGAHQRHDYDALQRPVAVFEQAAGQAQPRCVERLVYATPTPEHVALNRSGRLLLHADPAGTQVFEAYAMTGQVLGQTRRFREAPGGVDWPPARTDQDQQLEGAQYTTRWTLDALGGTVKQVDAKGNARQFAYGLDGQAKNVHLTLKGVTRKTVIERYLYNAAGQVEAAVLGNGVTSTATYRAEDGRMHRLMAYRKNELAAPLQDLSYDYDPVGNISNLQDRAQPTKWSHNTQVEASCRYEYDSLYQLTQATGRESTAAAIGQALPPRISFGSTDTGLWRNYTQHYAYDEGSNLTRLRHVPSSGVGYTREMRVASGSNRALSSEHPVAELAQGFDANGNQQQLGRSLPMTWNVRNQLTNVTTILREEGDPDEEAYVYAGDGQRALKLTHQQVAGSRQTARVYYLPGLEIRHQPLRRLNVVRLEVARCTVEVVQWELGLDEQAADETLRFCLTDQQSSHGLELGEQAQLLSQESYFPYGGTAWWASRSEVEGRYKTRRYSGKERDASGLYYYGFRYYAPWLQRWISPDPAGGGAALNPYLMAYNNPVTFVDSMGLQPAAVESAQIQGGTVILLLLVLLGLGAGALLGNATLGASVGALVGGVLFGASRLSAYQQMQPQAVARAAEQVEEQFARDISELAIKLAQQTQLSHEETERLVNFAYARRPAEGGMSLYVYSPQGSIYGYAGPVGEPGDVEGILTGSRNPMPELKRMGYGAVLLRRPERESASASNRQVGPSAFEAGATTQVGGSGRARGARQAPAQLPMVAPTAARADAPRMQIDTLALGNVDPLSREGRSIALTLSHLGEGRLGAVHWHSHKDQLWSADLHGYAASRGRGAYRLMLKHLGGQRYRVEGIRNPHR